MTNVTEIPEVETSGRRSHRLLWISLGIVVILIVAGVIGFIVIRNSESDHLEAGRAAIASGDWSAAVAALDQAVATQPAFLRQHTTEAAALRGLAYYQQAYYGLALADFDAALAANPELVDLRVYRADVAYRQDETEKAAADLETALAQADLLPDHLAALAHADQALIYGAQDKPEEALKEADAALALKQYLSDVEVAALYASRAQAAYDLGDDEESLSDSQAALLADTGLNDAQRAELLANQAMIYHQAGHLDQALEAADRGLALEALSGETQAQVEAVRADVLFRQGDIEGAIAAAERAIPSQGEAAYHALLAVKHHQAGEAAEALDEAETALGADADNAIAHRIRGSNYAWHGQYQAALTDLDRALELDSADIEALAMRIFVNLELNDLTAAEADLSQIQATNPAAPAALWAEAMIDIKDHNYQKARALLDLAIEMDESRPELYTWRAGTYRLSAEHDQVTADLEQALALDGDFLWALAQRMDEQGRQTNYATYEADATRLVDLYPDWYRGYSALASYYLFIQDDPETALSYIEKTLDLQPEMEAGYLYRGYYHLANQTYDLAQADFEQAQALSPNSIRPLEALADLYWAQGDYDQAAQYLEEIVAIDPSPGVLVQSAVLLAEQGKLDLAWKKVHQALALDPDNPDVLALRAKLYLSAGEPDRAQLDLHRALDQQPNDAENHLTQARVYFFQDRLAESREAATQALELDGNLAEARWLLLRIAIAEEDMAAAERQAQEWVAADPDMAEAHYWLGYVYNSEVKSQEALDSLTTSLELAKEDDPLLGDIYFERALANLDLSEEETAKGDLESTVSSTTDLDLLDDAEVLLVNPGLLAQSVGGRRIIEDPSSGYTISFDEKWQQFLADPATGYVLSLGYVEDDMIVASVDVFVDEWMPSFSLYDLAEVINPAPNGALVAPIEQVQIAGRNGLLQAYEIEDSGVLIVGQQYMVASGDRAAVIIVEAVDESYNEFESEFEALVASFDFLP